MVQAEPKLGNASGELWWTLKSWLWMDRIHPKSYLATCRVVQSHFSRVLLFATSWTVAHQAPLTTGFSRQEYWSGWPCSPPGYLPDPGIEPASPGFAGRIFTTKSKWVNQIKEPKKGLIAEVHSHQKWGKGKEVERSGRKRKHS